MTIKSALSLSLLAVLFISGCGTPKNTCWPVDKMKDPVTQEVPDVQR